MPLEGVAPMPLSEVAPKPLDGSHHDARAVAWKWLELMRIGVESNGRSYRVAACASLGAQTRAECRW